MMQQMPLGVTAVMLPELGLDEQVALCVELGVTHYVFRPRTIPQAARGGPWHSHGNHKFDLTPQRLIDEGPTFRATLESAGMTPFCTVPAGTADDPDDLFKRYLDGTAASGCGRIKVTPPPYPAGVFDYPAYLDRAIGRYRELCDLARPHDIKIVIEMHAGNSAASPGLARNLVAAFDPRHLGVIVDLPNFAREGFVEPGLAVSVLRPWIDHVHLGGLRRTPGDYDARGFRQSGVQMCALTESDLHIPTWIERIAEAAPAAPLVIEDYSGHMPGGLKLRLNVEAVKRVMG